MPREAGRPDGDAVSDGTGRSRKAGKTDKPLTLEEPVTPDETGLDLARALAGRLAAGSRGSRRRRSAHPSSQPHNPGGADRPGRTGQPMRGQTGRGTAPGSRVGGLATPEPFTGPAADANDPATLAAALRQLLDVRGWREQTEVWTVLSRWAELVGEQTAAHCQPVSLRDGDLRVRADSSAWATQLRLLTPRIVATVNDQLGSPVLRSVVVDGPVGPSWRHGRLGVSGGRGPRDTYG